MKKFITEKELLSAYIDGELSPVEKKSVEDKIKSSLELQKELTDLKKLKELTASSFGRISESPFFETRLFSNLNSETSGRFNIKKWIPISALTLITLTLMTVLKLNPNLINNIVEKQKSNIAGFYKENLQPLLYAADLTNEDIFNFAVYEELPLDSSNQQVLKLGFDPAGSEYFEIKNAYKTSQSNNLKCFVDALDLNDAEVEMIDSIIESYSDQLSSLVLVNDKNSVAINPNIWNTRKVILADILSFAKRHAGQNYLGILPTEVTKLDNNTIMKWVNDTKSVKANQYIFFTPDSIFEDDFVFDMEDFKVQMENVKDELAELNEQQDKLREFKINFDSAYGNHKRNFDKSKRYEISVDRDQIKVNVQGFAINIPELDFPDFDSIAIIINEATKNINTVTLPSPPVVVGKNNYNYNFNTVIPKRRKNTEVSLDSLMHQRNIENDIQNSEQKKRNLNQSKSISSYNINDSLILKQNQELQREMDILRKELKKFRNDFTRPNESDSGQSKKNKQQVNPVDIDEIEI